MKNCLELEDIVSSFVGAGTERPNKQRPLNLLPTPDHAPSLVLKQANTNFSCMERIDTARRRPLSLTGAKAASLQRTEIPSFQNACHFRMIVQFRHHCTIAGLPAFTN